MAETYIITAKTVKEAIEIANREYADENHEVTYDILEMPKKGFLGIGAKDAKIKITVTKTVSLDSIVSDLRSLKVFTDKGEGGEKQPKQNEKKPQNNRQNGQNNQKSRENSEKQAAPQSEKSEKKPQNAQPKAEKPQQNNQPKAKSENGEKPQQNQPKQKKEEAVKPEKPQTSESKQNQPKAEKKQSNAEKPQQNNAPKAKSENAASQPEKKAEAPVREKVHAEKAPAEEAKAAPEVKAEVKEQKKEEKRSSLNNQGKPSRRQHQKPSSEQNIEASAVAVSTPMGLSDFVPSENNASFGSANEKSSSGRMSNDIRKAKKNQPKAEKPQQNNQPKAGGKNERVIYEDRKSMITRYDVAESDDDYKKLDSLEAREMTIDEIRESVKCQNVREEVPAVEEAVEEIAAAPVQKSRREAVSEAEMTFALEFANTLLRNMGLDASAVPAECPEGEEFDTKEGCTVYPKINIIGDDTGILIGHHGETLDSIQYLVNLSALRKSKQKDGDYVKIVVDIENYREKREETLRVLARRMAAKAVKYKRNVFLEPMNAYERRIIHSELQNVENVSTHSVGTDRDRKIIITYEGADKAPENKNRRRRNPRPHNDNVNGETAGIEAAENTESGEKAQGSGSNRERRRPKKVQKMPIEKIGDILPDSDSAESEE